MQNDTKSVSIQQILRLSSMVDEYPLGTDIVVGEANGSDALADSRILRTMTHPIRFDGMMLFFLQKGHFTIDFNLNTYEVSERSLLVSTPGNIIRLPEFKKENLADIRLVFILLSKEYYSGLHLDFNKVFQDSLQVLANPCIKLNDEQLEVAESYYKLAKQILTSKITNKREVLGGLIRSLTYVTDDIWTGQIVAARASYGKSTSSHRTKQIFDKFIELVTEHHSTERRMQFYADQMCLSPKYLSKVVCEASGRSGPDWINSFVVLEAKNLLRYSGLTIKEVVFQLNFNSQSVFNKFFKANTGMTPSQYRRSK